MLSPERQHPFVQRCGHTDSCYPSFYPLLLLFTFADQDTFEKILYLTSKLTNKKGLVLDDMLPEAHPKAMVPYMPVGVQDSEDRKLQTGVSNTSTLTVNTLVPSDSQTNPFSINSPCLDELSWFY